MLNSIVVVDEWFHREGFQEGYKEDRSLGVIEGRQCGMLYGAETR